MVHVREPVSLRRRIHMSFEAWEQPLDVFHHHIGGALLVWILIVIHAGAALYHRYYKEI